MAPDHAFLGHIHPAGRAVAPLPRGAASAEPHTLEHGAWTLSWSAMGDATLAHSGTHGLAFLGELYSAQELRRTLDTAPDLPTVNFLLQAYERWGPEFAGQLDFLGVLALWADGVLHVFRDGSAARNLYHTRLPDGGLAFATHLDALFTIPGVECRLCRRSVHEYLRFLDISAPNTIYEGVYALPPGEALRWDAEETRSDPLPPPAGAPPPAASFAEALDTLDELLLASTAARLEGAARPAAFLSGGVDSSLLCAQARRVNPATTAITVGFEGEPYDESPVARAVAGHLGLPHQVLRFDREQTIGALERFNHQAEQPFADPAIPPTLLAFEYCREHYDAVLDGSGADESVGVMPPRHVRVAIQYADRLPSALRRGLVTAMSPIPKVREYTPVLDFEHPAELMIRWNGFTRQEIEALCGEPVDFAHTRFFRVYDQFPRGAHFERFSALEDAMPNDRLHQSAAITGLPVRYPYSAPHADTFIRTLPVDYRYRPEAPKRILRELLARHVPRDLWDTPKHGFDFPLREFLAADRHALVRHYLDPDLWRSWGIADPAAVGGYGARFMAGDSRLMFRVWVLVVLSVWLTTHAPGNS